MFLLNTRIGAGYGGRFHQRNKGAGHVPREPLAKINHQVPNDIGAQSSSIASYPAHSGSPGAHRHASLASRVRFS